MKPEKLISVVVLNYNGIHHLDGCLSSLQKQTYKNYEVIVVDNGSKDGSQEFVKTNFPFASLVCLDQNYGFCKGNNEGIKVSKGEYVVLLNNDTFVESEWLKNLYVCINSDEHIGFCASKMILYNNREFLDSAGDGFAICGAGYKRGHLEKASEYIKDEYVFGASGGAVIYKREMLDKLGLLDEDFFAIYEDVDLSFRAQIAGYKCKFASKAVVYHKVNATIGAMSDFYVYHGQRNAEYVYFKNMPGKLMIRTMFPHLLYNFLAFGYFLLKGKGLVFVKAKFDFLRNFKTVLQKRKRIQAEKTVDDSSLLSLFERRWMETRIRGK